MSHIAHLAHSADFDGWRNEARRLAERSVPADAILWQVEGTRSVDLFAAAAGDMDRPAEAVRQLRVPKGFLELAERVVCHTDPERFALLYTMLMRLQDRPALLYDRAEPLVDRLEEMGKAVSRDIHKMRAFVRFRDAGDETGPHFIAWFEPEHHIVRLNAGFFVRRFASQRWTIMTPEVTAHWDLQELCFLPGATREDAPGDDPVETIWKTYYGSIFNPARLKVDAMRGEMPKKYWRNLPEASVIPELIASAGKRTEKMIADAQPATDAPAANLKAVRDEAKRCTRCPLYAPATQTVFGEGPADAELMFVGEQPGDQEDLAGRPFIGPAGQLFDRALNAAGVDRSRTYVTNAVKHFKFEQRGKRRIHAKPGVGEIDACRWWIDQERALVKPKLTVMLGATAARSLTGRTVTIGRERGRILTLPDGSAGFITVHPSFLLRVDDPEKAAEEYTRFVEDLQAAWSYVAERV